MFISDRRPQRVRVPRIETPLRRLRRVRTLTQKQMAGLLTVTQQTYSKYESGVLVPDSVTRHRIAAILGVTVRELWPQGRRTPRVPVPTAEAQV